MNYKKQENDSGSYINGVYTTKNGFSGSGLNCPKGTRLYDTSVNQPVFFMPEDRELGEDYEMITQEVCPGILPYYAVSNYGHIMNIKTGQIMKENYRPNGYGYYCLCAEDAKYGQKKYTTHRIVMETFDPREDAKELQVNHKNGNKKDNYYNKLMEDGTYESNLEWSSPKENIDHAHDTGLWKGNRLLDQDKANHIRELRNQGYTYSKIRSEFYPNVSEVSIQNICNNKTYKDPNYNPPKQKQKYAYFNVSKQNISIIKNLYGMGVSIEDIRDRFFPTITTDTISTIINFHNKNE